MASPVRPNSSPPEYIILDNGPPTSSTRPSQVSEPPQPIPTNIITKSDQPANSDDKPSIHNPENNKLIHIALYPAAHFTQFSGAILFCSGSKTPAVYLLHDTTLNLYSLPTTRRVRDERPQDCALRAAATYIPLPKRNTCQLQVLPLATTSTALDRNEFSSRSPLGDHLRRHSQTRDAFALRTESVSGHATLTWWFAVTFSPRRDIMMDVPMSRADFQPDGLSRHRTEMHGYDEALERITSPVEREVLQQAVGLVKETYPPKEEEKDGPC